MNPTVAQRVVDEAMERDAAMAAAEYGAQFHADIENIADFDEALDVGVELGTVFGGGHRGVALHRPRRLRAAPRWGSSCGIGVPTSMGSPSLPKCRRCASHTRVRGNWRTAISRSGSSPCPGAHYDTS